MEVELFEQHIVTTERHSSKGNQLKWKDGEIWYKADYTGYEGLSEYIISNLLKKSSLNSEEFVIYEPVNIRYKNNVFTGVKSNDFLDDDWQIITLERLFKEFYGKSMYETVWKIQGIMPRFKFMIEQMERITSITDMGVYFAKLFTIDAFFLNEDRHMHNIAVLINEEKKFKLCPIFDNGASLLSDTKMDYPLDEDVFSLLKEVRAKSISTDFDEQLDVAEMLYDDTIKFYFTQKDVNDLLDSITIYDKKEIERVRTIIFNQMNKYNYMFQKKIKPSI